MFPKGLRIGRATKVNEAAHGLFKSAELVPFVDFDRLEEVQVVVDHGPSARLDRPFDSIVQ
jgi:cell shape-determining protein MreC